MNILRIASLALISLACACLGRPEAPGDPATVPVSGEDAHQWDACRFDGDIGRECTQTCREGGQAHGRFECVQGTWRCIVLSTATCSGSNVPTTPADASAPSDASTQPTDTNTADTTPPAPRGRVIISCGGPERNEVSTGAHMARLRQVNITSQERPLEVRRLGATINTSDGSGHTFAMDGSPYFHSVRVQDLDSGEVVMRATAPTPVGSDRHNAQIELRDIFYVGNNATRHLSIQTDTAMSESWRADFTGQFYAMRFGSPSLPYVFYAEDDLHWADTGEVVEQAQITYDPGCFSELRGFQFMVRSQNATILADLFHAPDAWSITITTPSQAMSLPLSFVNDGYEDGFVDGMTVDGTAIVDGSYTIPLNTVASDCRLFDSEGHILGTAGYAEPNRLVYYNISLRVPGVRNAFAAMHCTYHWPTDLLARSVVVRLGIGRSNLRARSGSGSAAIEGTPNLENNRVAPDAMAVTLLPGS